MGQIDTFKTDKDIQITPYDSQNDKQFVMSLIDKNPNFLSYEHAGKPAGTTEKYLTQENHYTFILRKNDNPIGFVNFAIKEDDSLGSIDLLGIGENHLRKGYGLLLIEYTIQKLKTHNISKASLIVNKENIKAQRLYEKLGFTAASKADSLRVWHYTKKL
jgi:ribosomal protein S18 acetylase RimI-like enzyme